MPRLSSRVRPSVRAPHLTLSAALYTKPYSAKNPEAAINLSVAENVLSLDEVAEGLRTHPRDNKADLKSALAKHYSVEGYEIAAEHVVVTSGATCALDALTYVTCSRGETVLVPAPGYGGVSRDVTTLSEARVRVYDAQTDDVVSAIDTAMTHDTHMVIVNNPCNPRGTLVTASEIRALAQYAERRGVHVVFDEAYVHSGYDGRCVSVWQAIGGVRARFVHGVYTLSKDLGVSGARVGAIVSQNGALLRAVQSLGGNEECTRTHNALASLLADRAWVGDLLQENCRRLAQAEKVVTQALREVNVEFVQPRSGVFVWANVRLLKGDGWDKAWRRLYDGGVLVTPGEDCFGDDGWCRICFAAVPLGVLRVAMQRFQKVVLAASSLEG